MTLNQSKYDVSGHRSRYERWRPCCLLTLPLTLYHPILFFFFLNDPPTPEISPLPLPAALPTPIGPRGRRACRDHNCSQQTFHSFSMIAGKRAHSPARAGTSTSRCPLAVRPLTRPAFSISSSRRADRL